MNQPWCCFIGDDGAACPAPAVWEVWTDPAYMGWSPESAFEAYTHVCAAHLSEVQFPEDAVHPLATEDRVMKSEEQACAEELERLKARRPRLPTPGAVERGQEAFRRGECEDVADILARMKAGGPLVKE